MVRALLIVAACVSGACLRAGAFHCTGDTECVSGGAPGVCQATGYCSYYDMRCDSGQRYASLAGELSGQCVTGVPLDAASDAPVDALPDAPPGFHRIGGTTSNLRFAGLVLTDNGGDDLAVPAGQPTFTFATAVASGMPYKVQVASQPSPLTCAVGAGSGIVGNTDVTDVGVSCSGDPGIYCGGTTFCDPATAVCCAPQAAATCKAPTLCAGIKLTCDDSKDCTNPTLPVCCAKFSSTTGAYQGSSCVAACGATYNIPMCDPAVANCNTLRPGTACKAITHGLPVGYYGCQ